MEELDEVVQTLDRLQAALEELTVRGLRPAGAGQLAALEMLREEFERVGAGHLAGRVAALAAAVRAGDRAAAAALLRVQASLRVFERVLTLEAVGETLQGLVQAAGGGS